jgi:hypothetical protein
LYGSSRIGELKFDEDDQNTLHKALQRDNPPFGAASNWHYEERDGYLELVYDYPSIGNGDGIQQYKWRYCGNRHYELCNHLGNVQVVVTDKKIPHEGTDGRWAYFTADILSVHDYYAFGQDIEERSFERGTYRYGMNGQEKDDDIFVGAFSAQYWEYDSRTGRRWNVDPKPDISVSDYATFANNPILFQDILGDTVSPGKGNWYNFKSGVADGWQDTKKFAKSLLTVKGWADVAMGIAVMCPSVVGIPEIDARRAMMVDGVVKGVAKIPSMTSEELSHAAGYATEKVAEAVVVSKGAGLAKTAIGRAAVAAEATTAPPLAAQSIWTLQPFARGRAAERILGANIPVPNYPIIDKFLNGVATSIKSIDLSAAAYQNPKTLERVLNGYVDKVAGFQGRPWGGYSTVGQVTSRELELAIPSVGTTAQQQAIQKVISSAASKGVKVSTHVIH